MGGVARGGGSRIKNFARRRNGGSGQGRGVLAGPAEMGRRINRPDGGRPGSAGSAPNGVNGAGRCATWSGRGMAGRGPARSGDTGHASGRAESYPVLLKYILLPGIIYDFRDWYWI